MNDTPGNNFLVYFLKLWHLGPDRAKRLRSGIIKNLQLSLLIRCYSTMPLFLTIWHFTPTMLMCLRLQNHDTRESNFSFFGGHNNEGTQSCPPYNGRPQHWSCTCSTTHTTTDCTLNNNTTQPTFSALLHISALKLLPPPIPYVVHSLPHSLSLPRANQH